MEDSVLHVGLDVLLVLQIQPVLNALQIITTMVQVVLLLVMEIVA
jgi:hypothetical protein